MLEEIIRQSGLTRIEISRRAGISRYHLYRVTKGLCIPSFNVACRIANVFGLPVQQVFIKEVTDDKI